MSEEIEIRVEEDGIERVKMTRQEKIQKLVEYVFERKYGDLIEHYEIERVIGEKCRTTKYSDIVSGAQKKLQKVGKVIENVRGVGYKIVMPDDYSDKAVDLIASGARRIEKGGKILRYAPVNEMSQSGLEAYNTTVDRVKVLSAAVVGAKVELNLLAKKRESPLQITERTV